MKDSIVRWSLAGGVFMFSLAIQLMVFNMNPLQELIKIVNGKQGSAISVVNSKTITIKDNSTINVTTNETATISDHNADNSLDSKVLAAIIAALIGTPLLGSLIASVDMIFLHFINSSWHRVRPPGILPYPAVPDQQWNDFWQGLKNNPRNNSIIIRLNLLEEAYAQFRSSVVNTQAQASAGKYFQWLMGRSRRIRALSLRLRDWRRRRSEWCIRRKELRNLGLFGTRARRLADDFEDTINVLLRSEKNIEFIQKYTAHRWDYWYAHIHNNSAILLGSFLAIGWWFYDGGGAWSNIWGRIVIVDGLLFIYLLLIWFYLNPRIRDNNVRFIWRLVEYRHLEEKS